MVADCVRSLAGHTRMDLFDLLPLDISISIALSGDSLVALAATARRHRVSLFAALAYQRALWLPRVEVSAGLAEFLAEHCGALERLYLCDGRGGRVQLELPGLDVVELTVDEDATCALLLAPFIRRRAKQLLRLTMAISHGRRTASGAVYTHQVLDVQRLRLCGPMCWSECWSDVADQSPIQPPSPDTPPNDAAAIWTAGLIDARAAPPPAPAPVDAPATGVSDDSDGVLRFTLGLSGLSCRSGVALAFAEARAGRRFVSLEAPRPLPMRAHEPVGVHPTSQAKVALARCRKRHAIPPLDADVEEASHARVRTTLAAASTAVRWLRRRCELGGSSAFAPAWPVLVALAALALWMRGQENAYARATGYHRGALITRDLLGSHPLRRGSLDEALRERFLAAHGAPAYTQPRGTAPTATSSETARHQARAQPQFQ